MRLPFRHRPSVQVYGEDAYSINGNPNKQMAHSGWRNQTL